MAIEGISISLGEVTRTAGTIRTLNASLTARLEEIKNEMNALESTWSSDASNSIRSNFNKFAPRFEQFREVVESYALFLDNTVTNYDTTETGINNNANLFR